MIDEDIENLKTKNMQLEDRIVKANKVVDKVNQMGFLETSCLFV